VARKRDVAIFEKTEPILQHCGAELCVKAPKLG